MMDRHFFTQAIRLLALFLFVCAWPAVAGAGSAGRRPNVLLVVTDDQRPDTIHALGNSVIETPVLDALVRRGTTFTRAIAPCPICTPSRAEIMSGVSGLHNGVPGFGGKLKPDLAPWAKTLGNAGYHAWYVGKWHNNGRQSEWGYEACLGLFAGGGRRGQMTCPLDWHGRQVTGYLRWVFQTDGGRTMPEKGVGLTPDISRKFADAAIRFIQRKPEKPFFLHVNFTAPHDPLLMPPGYENKYDPEAMPLPRNFLPKHPFDHGNLRGRDERLLPWPRTPEVVRKDLAVYYAIISHLDEQLGRIVSALEETGQAENTLIIFTSDHGLAIGSHGLRGKQNMYDHTVSVPLILAGPGIPKERRSDAQCYLRDLYPTICELVGVEAPGSLEGRSLVRVIRGEANSIRPRVFGHFRDVQRMVRTERWKLIHYPKLGRYQLFDLRNDPYERENLSTDPDQAGVMAELRRTLSSWTSSNMPPD